MSPSGYIRDKFDLGILRADGTTKVGMMLRRARNEVPQYQVFDDEYLAQQFFTGDAGYNNLPPEKELVIRQDDLRSGFGIETYDNNDPKRYFNSIGMDMRFRGKAIAGPKSIGTVTLPGTVVPANLINTNMELTTGWTLGVRSTAQKHTGGYSWYVVTGPTDAYQDATTWIAGWQSKEFTFSCYVWCNTASVGRIGINDKAGDTSYSAYHTGGSTWERLSVTKTLAVDADKLRVYLESAGVGAELTYFDDASISTADETGTIVDWVDFNDKLYAAYGKTLVVLNAGGTAFTSVRQFTSDITDLEVFTSGGAATPATNLYIALGYSCPYWQMTSAEAFTINTLAVNTIKYFAYVRTTADTMYGSDDVNKIRSTINPADGGTAWSGQTTVDSSLFSILQLFTSSGALYVRKQNRPYYLNSSGVVKDDLAPELESLSRSIASQDIIEWLAKLYMPWGDQALLEEDSGTLTWRNPSDFATGLSDFNGKIFAIAADDRYLYAISNNGAKIEVLSGRLEEIDGSIVWVWHPINETPLVGCLTCHISNVVQKRLWISSTDIDDLLYYIPLPLGYADVVNDTNRSFVSGGAIDVGSAVSDRASTLAGTVTYIDGANTADYDGRITSIAVWAAADMTGFRVGTFYLVSGTTYKCRDSATLGAVTAGSSQTFIQDSGGSLLSIAVKLGDYIGCYFATGTIERDTAGFNYVAYYNGEAIDAGDSAAYSVYAGDAISLYATGVRGAIMETPWLHGNFKSTTKAFPSLELVMGHTYNTGRYFTVKYKKLGDSTWTSIGNYTGSATSMTESKFIPADASSNKPKATMFRLQFTAVTDDTTITPILLSYHLKAILYPSQREIIACKVYCSNEIQLKDGTVDNGSYDTIIATLDEARVATWPVTIYDINGDTKTVKFLAVSSGAPRWQMIASEKERRFEREYNLLAQVVTLS